MKKGGYLLLGLSLVFSLSCRNDAERVKRNYLERGNKHFAAGQDAEAVINYRKAISKDAKYAEAYYRLGLAEIKRSRIPHAYQALTRALELQPANLDAKIKLAGICLSGYLLDPQRPAYMRTQIAKLAGELKEPTASPYDGFRISGLLAMLEGRRTEAIEFLSKADSLRPLQPDVTLALAQGYLLEKQTQRGEELAWRLIRAEKSFGAIYDALYVHYVTTRRFADAEKLLRTKVENNPLAAEFALELAGHYFRAQKAAEMNAVLARLLDDPKSFPKARLQIGDFYRTLGKTDEAARQYKEGERVDAAGANAYRKRLTLLLLSQGKTEEAATLVDTVLKTQPKDEESLVIRARLRMTTNSAEELDAAIADLKGLVASNPDRVDLRIELGKAHQAKRDFDAARVQFQEAVRRRREYSPARLALAELNLATGDYKGAQRSVDEVLASAPDDLPAKILRAAALTGNGDYELARNELVRVTKRFPGSRPAELQLAMVDLAERKYKDAERILRKHYQPGQTDLRPLDGLVESYTAQGQTQQALELLQGELRSAPNSHEVRLRVARAAIRSGNPDLALEHYTKLLAGNPKSASLHFSTGEAFRLKGEWTRAAEAFQRATEFAPKDANALSRLGLALEMIGRKQEAMVQYQHVLALQPEDPFALNNLAFLLADTGGNLDEALRLAERAQRTWPDNPKISDTIGWIYLKRKNHESAQQIFSRLVAKHPSEPSFRYHLGVVLLQTGQTAAAKTELQTALTYKPTKEDETKIRDLIARIG